MQSNFSPQVQPLLSKLALYLDQTKPTNTHNSIVLSFQLKDQPSFQSGSFFFPPLLIHPYLKEEEINLERLSDLAQLEPGT